MGLYTREEGHETLRQSTPQVKLGMIRKKIVLLKAVLKLALELQMLMLAHS